MAIVVSGVTCVVSGGSFETSVSSVVGSFSAVAATVVPSEVAAVVSVESVPEVATKGGGDMLVGRFKKPPSLPFLVGSSLGVAGKTLPVRLVPYSSTVALRTRG